MGQREGQAGEKGIRHYLEDRMYRWKAPHGGHSNNLSHQMSPQKMRLQLMKLEVGTTDPAFSQEPDHRGVRGQEKWWWRGSSVWQLELEKEPECGEGTGCARCPADAPSLAYLTPPFFPKFA